MGKPQRSEAATSSGWLRGMAAVAAHLGGVSVKSISKWTTAGILPVTRLPGSRLMLYRVAAVDAALAKFTSDARG